MNENSNIDEKAAIGVAKENTRGKKSSKSSNIASADIVSNVEKFEVGQQKGTEVSIKTLLEAGAHFGHETERWNPRVIPYIFGERNGVHIINLDLTLQKWREARNYIVKNTSEGGTVLFVGTKAQVRETVAAEALRCGSFYMVTRWLGGTLTNFETIKRSIDRMKKLEDLIAESLKEDTKVKLIKKEKLTLSRQVDRLADNIGGIRSMKNIPQVLVVLDVNKEHIAISEAKKLHIPIIGVVDTNADPTLVDYPIPANDDSTKTISLIVSAIADAIIEGKTLYQSRMARSSNDQVQSEKSGRGGKQRTTIESQELNTAATNVATV